MYTVRRDTTDTHVHGHNYVHVFLNSLLKYIARSVYIFLHLCFEWQYINFMFAESDTLMHTLYCNLTGRSY